MANVLKRAALAFGRWTGLHREPRPDAGLTLIEPVAEAMITETTSIDDMIDAAIAEQGGLDNPNSILPPTDAPTTPWNEAPLTTEAVTSETDSLVASESLSAVTTGDLLTESAASTTEQPLEIQPVAEAEVAPIAEVAPVVAVVEEFREAAKAPIEMKPEVAEPIRAPKPSVSFTQLYELISTEVNKRSDSTVAVYERLLAAQREELEGARRGNKVAWSVGGVMTAVAAMGAVWSAAEVAGTRVEVGALKHQVSAANGVALERDQLRSELMKVTQVNAKLEIGSLQSRLDEALAISADRDKLRGELETARKAAHQAESELRIARVAATTQPVSDARPASGKVTSEQTTVAKAAGAERPDVWSVLLNGQSND